MALLKYLLPIFVIAAIRSVVCTSLSRALPVLEMGPFGPSLPATTEYVPFNGMGTSFSLAIDKYDFLFLDFDQCKANATIRGVHAWFHDSDNDRCFYASLVHPVCRSYQGEQAGFILAEYLSDGSPSDNAVLDPVKTGDLLQKDNHVAFRVDAPTILQIEGFKQPVGFAWAIAEQENKIVIMPNDGSIVSTDERILVDPSCRTNSSCGVPFLTTSVGLSSLPYLILHDVCDEVINVNQGEGINMFSHAGTGCQFFPDTYPSSRCFVIFKGRGTLKIDVTLVNFRKTDCDGFRLVALVSHSNQTRTSHDICAENGPTELYATGGRVRFFFYNTQEPSTYQKYGFIISVLNFGNP